MNTFIVRGQRKDHLITLNLTSLRQSEFLECGPHCFLSKPVVSSPISSHPVPSYLQPWNYRYTELLLASYMGAANPNSDPYT